MYTLNIATTKFSDIKNWKILTTFLLTEEWVASVLFSFCCLDVSSCLTVRELTEIHHSTMRCLGRDSNRSPNMHWCPYQGILVANTQFLETFQLQQTLSLAPYRTTWSTLPSNDWNLLVLRRCLWRQFSTWFFKTVLSHSSLTVNRGLNIGNECGNDRTEK